MVTFPIAVHRGGLEHVVFWFSLDPDEKRCFDALY
jgi:hypothetical protein